MFHREQFTIHQLFLAAATIIFGAIGGMTCWPQTTFVEAPTPRLHIGNRKVDLGTIYAVATRDVSFSVANKGLCRLVLNEVGCGCGEPPRAAILIPPGKTTDVVVTMNFQASAGEIERKTSFATNDPRQPLIDLIVTARVNEE